MLYPSRMKRTTVLAHADHISPLVRELQRTGLMQIDPLDTEGLEPCSPDRSRLEQISSRFEQVFGAIRYEEEESIREMVLHPRPPEVFAVPELTVDELLHRSETILEPIEARMAEFDGKLTRLRERSSGLEDLKVDLVPLQWLDLDVSMLGSGEYATVVAGTTRDLEGLQGMLDSELIHVFHQGSETEMSVVIIAHTSQRELLEKARRQRYFDAIDPGAMDILGQDPGAPGSGGRPRDIIGEIETELLAIRKEEDGIRTSLRELYADHRKEILILREEIDIALGNHRIFDRFGGTKATVALKGWVEADRTSELEDLVERATRGYGVVETDDPEANEAPTLLRNRPWARPFESLVHMFATPKYNELDTSMIVGPLFIIFFGLMLGDAGYGLIIVAVALFMLRVHAPHSAEVRDYGYYLLLMGTSAVVFGLIMGGFFYDAIPRFVYGDETLALYPAIGIPGFSFPIDPMNDPLTIFMASLIIGLLTLNIGILLAAYHHWREGNYHELVTGDISWFIFQPGGILLIGYFMFDAFALGPGTVIICAVTAALGILLRLVHSKGLAMFDFTGFMGNVLSFARILALGLATAGIALAINNFAQLAGEIHPALIILGILLFVGAHFVNTLLQALGAGIHSIRLNYVEFFSMFYEGGGKTFDPFREERTYTQVDVQENNT